MNINVTLTFEQFCEDLKDDFNSEAYLEKLLWPFDFFISDKTATDVLIGHIIEDLALSKKHHEILSFEEVLESASDLGHCKAEDLLNALGCIS